MYLVLFILKFYNFFVNVCVLMLMLLFDLVLEFLLNIYYICLELNI